MVPGNRRLSWSNPGPAGCGPKYVTATWPLLNEGLPGENTQVAAVACRKPVPYRLRYTLPPATSIGINVQAPVAEHCATGAGVCEPSAWTRTAVAAGAPCPELFTLKKAGRSGHTLVEVGPGMQADWAPETETHKTPE